MNLEEKTSCPCGSGVECPPCVLAKTMRQMHQLASENADEDASQQSQNQQQSVLEMRLFQQAKQYAQTAAKWEQQARLQSLLIQRYSSDAQIARNKMVRVCWHSLLF